MHNQIVDIALAAAGLVLTIFAITWHKHLSGQQVVDIAAEKLGVALKTDAFGLVVLLGCLMVITGIFFRYQKYEDKTKTLEAEKKVWEQFAQDQKTYNLQLNLIFPAGDQPDPANSKLVFKAYIQKKGESEVQLNHTAGFTTGLGGIIVAFEKLNYGDKLYVEIEGGQKKWRSDEIITPAAHLRMYAIK